MISITGGAMNEVITTFFNIEFGKVDLPNLAKIGG